MNILGYVPKMPIKLTYICNETDMSYFCKGSKGCSYSQQAVRNFPVWQIMYLDNYILYLYFKKNQTIVFSKALPIGKELLRRASSTGIQVHGGPKLLSRGLYVCIILYMYERKVCNYIFPTRLLFK
jgi:hypothetical protein